MTLVAGVMLASFGDLTLAMGGILAMLYANVSIALSNNITQVGFARPDRLTSTNSFYRTAQLGALVAFPAALLECRANWHAPSSVTDLMHMIPLVVLNGCMFFIYNQAVYAILKCIKMATYSALNSIRRGVAIVATTLYFKSQVTVLNLVGLVGVACGFAWYFSAVQQRLEKVVNPDKV